jgi:DNA polymerase-3 subunit epsilon
LVERRPTGRTYQQYIHPDREFEPGAQEVTGLTLEFLADKPRFAEIADGFLEFVDGAELIIHNAAFDVGFLDNELSLLGPQYGRLRDRISGIEDSLDMARKRYPGQRNSLDALCKRLGVDNAHRHLHGALLDAQLLVDVYLALTSGQSEIGFAPPVANEGGNAAAQVDFDIAKANAASRPRVRVGEDEQAAHLVRLAAIRKKAGRCVWDEA